MTKAEVRWKSEGVVNNQDGSKVMLPPTYILLRKNGESRSGSISFGNLHPSPDSSFLLWDTFNNALNKIHIAHAKRRGLEAVLFVKSSGLPAAPLFSSACLFINFPFEASRKQLHFERFSAERETMDG